MEYTGINYDGIDNPSLLSGDVITRCVFYGSGEFDPIFGGITGLTFVNCIFYDCCPQAYGNTFTNCNKWKSTSTDDDGLATGWGTGIDGLPKTLQYYFMVWVKTAMGTKAVTEAIAGGESLTDDEQATLATTVATQFKLCDGNGFSVFYWLEEDETVTDYDDKSRYSGSQVWFYGYRLNPDADDVSIRQYIAWFCDGNFYVKPKGA